MLSHQLRNRLLIITTLLVAFALRLAAIDQTPPGLSHDEAYNGVTAIEVLNGQHRIFFEINKGIEPLIIYLEALAFYFFGISPVSLRLVNVFCGLLTVALVYPLTVRLFNRRLALLAMAGIAISFWAIFVSRLTLRAVTLPPLLMLTLYFFWRGLKPTTHHQLPIITLIFFALSGIAAGATMYTYLSSRFTPFIIVAIFGYQLTRGQIKRQHWLGLLLHFLLWAIIFAPLANYYLKNADSFARRADQVTTIPYLLNGEFEPTLKNSTYTLGMFTFYGDETDRYNLDGRPIFDWVNGFIFYLGVGIALLRLRRSENIAAPAALLMIWGFFMLLPDFITDDSPHFLRTIGALPAVYICWAMGLAALDRFIGQHLHFRLPNHFPDLMPQISTVVIMLLLLATTAHTIYDYFGRWANATEARYIYGADIAKIGQQLKDTPIAGDFPAISTEYYRDLDPFRFIIYFQGQPPFAIWFDGRQSLAFPPPQSGLTPSYFFARSAPAAAFWQPFLQASTPTVDNDYTLYHLENEAKLDEAWAETFPAENNLTVNINDDLVLLSYRLLDPLVSGGKLRVLLGWQALRTLPPGTDYTFLARLRDRQGHIWVEADGNGYTPSDWQPGARALQLLTLRLPGDLPPKTFQLTIEVVDRRQEQALPSTTGDRVIPLAALVAQLADKPRTIDPARLPNPTAISPTAGLGQIEPGIFLRGYKVNRRNLHPGDTLSLTLHWQVLEQPEQDYNLLFWLAAANDKTQNHPSYHWPLITPVDEAWPTSRWPSSYWVQDRLDLPIDAEIPPGQFNLQGQWVNEATNRSEQISFDLGSIIIESR